MDVNVPTNQGLSAPRHVLRRNAIRAISERLSDAESSISDETITAVALLAIEEVRYLNHLVALLLMKFET